jgi:YYY domain-containing protein
MTAVLNWWLMMAVFAIVTLPISWRLFGHLPGRGYAWSRPLGMLLVGYVLWLGGMFGFLRPTRVAILFALTVVSLVSAYIFWRHREDILTTLRQNRRLIIATELVFAVAFASWAVVRAYNPEIAATEKPMEIAFLNAILRSERFPPIDPWLSGFAISYYYFGYLMIAMLTRLSGVPSEVAFNLGKALLFALTATGCFGLLHDLITLDQGERVKGWFSRILWSLLGPVFVLVMGNLEVVFEMLHTRGLGSAAFWNRLDVNGLIDAPISGQWIPRDNWWWWRASRVVNDRDLIGSHQEVIDEFPQFSFLLGDMHPHVLGLPFVVLCLGLALNLLVGARSWIPQDDDEPEALGWDPRRWAGMLWCRGQALWRQHGADILPLALCLGALGFINTWDLPVYLLVIVGAFWIGQRKEQRRDALWTTAVFAAPLAVLSIALYLPFFLTFQSQAGGVLPLFFNVTRVHQYLMMFGVFVFVIGSFLAVQIVRDYRQEAAGKGWLHSFLMDLLNSLLWLATGPLLVLALAVLLVVGTKNGRQFLQGVLADAQVQKLIGATGTLGLLRQAILLRITNPWTFLLLALLLSALWYLIQASWRSSRTMADRASLFAYIMAGMAFLMTLGTEFIYLRDTFGTRMNTIFKFYYQAWVLMGLAAAFAAYYLVGRPADTTGRRTNVLRLAWAVLVAAVVAAGMLYPLLAIPNKTGGFDGQATLDGLAFMKQSRPDEYAAIQWLRAHVPGTDHIVEATGGSFTEYAPISAFTGLPTLLGWGGHELQWRGNYDEPGKRERDLEAIYQSTDSQEVLTLLDKYQVRYVCLGPLETQKYGLRADAATRLGRVLETVFQQGNVTIFQR